MLQNFSTKEPIMVFATSKCIGGTVSRSLPTIPLLVHSSHNLDFCEKLKYTYPQFHKLMPLTTKATAINSHKIRTQNRNWCMAWAQQTQANTELQYLLQVAGAQ
jgi:hypothetical protein